jgi:hypothetical protein
LISMYSDFFHFTSGDSLHVLYSCSLNFIKCTPHWSQDLSMQYFAWKFPVSW